MPARARHAVARFRLPPLPYPDGALAPFLSGASLDEHRARHHAPCVAELNGLVSGTPLEDAALETLVVHAPGPVRTAAASHANHSFFWKCLSPRGGGGPSMTLAERLVGQWGSFATFRSAFTDAALALPGDGWTWLALREGRLSILARQGTESPLRDGFCPLLALDGWGHAFAADYGGNRRLYVRAFWELVDWNFVAENLDRAENQSRVS